VVVELVGLPLVAVSPHLWWRSSPAVYVLLVGWVVGGGGIRGWRLDEVTVLNPSLAKCLIVRVCSE
jgi:hypothetical protein